MLNRIALAGLLMAAVAGPGCLPEARVIWSPDGRYALVRGADGLYLCDGDGGGDGKLSPRIAEDVPAAAWTPNSREFIAACGRPITTWEELLPHLPEKVKESISAQAESFRRQVLAYKGEWGSFRFLAEPGDIMAALLCLRDTHGKELAPAVGEAWSATEKWRHTVYAVQVFGVAGGQAKLTGTLFNWPGAIAEIRMAPGGKAVAFTGHCYPPQNAEPDLALYVAVLASKEPPARLANRVSVFFDWTPDGRSLVYARAALPDAHNRMPSIALGVDERQFTYRRERMRNPQQQPLLRPGEIVRCEVFDGDGSLKKDAASTYIASVPFYDSLPIRCLKDGRILFAARQAQLPAAAVPSQDLMLFSTLLADRAALKPVLAPEARKQLGNRLDLFQLSPDEMRICVPDESGKLTVLHLGTGQVTVVPGEHRNGLRMIPTWRSNDELCFQAFAGAEVTSAPTTGPAGATAAGGATTAPARRDEIILWSPAGSRCLSRDWPDAARGFLPAAASSSSSGGDGGL